MVAVPDRRILRASDADRDAVVARLRHHGAAGRLEVSEMTERIEAALEAKTLGQLDALLGDLPREPTSPPMAPLPTRAEILRSGLVLPRIVQLAIINLICLAIWTYDGARAGVWPVFVLIASVLLVLRRVNRVAAREARRRRRALRNGADAGQLGR